MSALLELAERDPLFALPHLSVTWRNPGHWDVFAERGYGYPEWWEREHPNSHVCPPIRQGDRERAFRIRGEPGDVRVSDERWDPSRPFPRGWLKFPTVEAAFAWIVGELLIARESAALRSRSPLSPHKDEQRSQ